MKKRAKITYNMTMVSVLAVSLLLFIQVKNISLINRMSIFDLIQNNKFVNLIFMNMMINIVVLLVLFKTKDYNVITINEYSIICNLTLFASLNILSVAFLSHFLFKQKQINNNTLTEIIIYISTKIKTDVKLKLFALANLFLITTFYITLFKR